MIADVLAPWAIFYSRNTDHVDEKGLRWSYRKVPDI